MSRGRSRSWLQWPYNLIGQSLPKLYYDNKHPEARHKQHEESSVARPQSSSPDGRCGCFRRRRHRGAVVIIAGFHRKHRYCLHFNSSNLYPGAIFD
jgi:hypothetical protein